MNGKIRGRNKSFRNLKYYAELVCMGWRKLRNPPPTHFNGPILLLPSHLRLDIPCFIIPSEYLIEIVCAFLFFFFHSCYMPIFIQPEAWHSSVFPVYFLLFVCMVYSLWPWRWKKHLPSKRSWTIRMPVSLPRGQYSSLLHHVSQMN
jgi:hypothetical protein